MLTKKQLEMLEVFYKDIFNEVTFKQIKEESKQRSNNVVQIAIKKYLKEELIKSKRTGNVTTYSINMSNNLVFGYLNLINQFAASKKSLPENVIMEIKKKVLKHTEFFILAVFGSYAKGKATKSSDLDIVLIVENDKIKNEIIPSLETVKRREIIKVDYHIFTRTEFLEMLKSDMENLGKQIFKNSIIIQGYIEYLNLIRSMKN